MIVVVIVIVVCVCVCDRGGKGGIGSRKFWGGCCVVSSYYLYILARLFDAQLTY